MRLKTARFLTNIAVKAIHYTAKNGAIPWFSRIEPVADKLWSGYKENAGFALRTADIKRAQVIASSLAPFRIGYLVL